MSRIKVMSEALSNRIAAGEVIERPASVVKELLENSVDAGAAHVSIVIERAGSRLISVADDGCGMDAEDALLALEPHGTSKLSDEEGLSHIRTLGFRGEALPSIASVSRFTLRTRPAGEKEGTCVTTEGGAAPSIAPCGGPTGTAIEVRDLFFNLPARRKFLKSAATEEHHIEEMVYNLAIGCWETGFTLTMDNRTVFRSPGAKSLEERLRELLGRGFMSRMLPVEHREGDLHISGFIAAPGFTRNVRRDQRCFLNARAIEAPALYRGIREGYGALACEAGRYPPVVLFLEMPPEEVDVNVHPAKREVRFRAEYTVSRAVAAAVSSALRKLREPETAAAALTRSEIQEKSLPLSGKVPLSFVLDAAEVRYDPAPVKQPELKLGSGQDTVVVPEEPVPQKTDESLFPDLPEEEKHITATMSFLSDSDHILPETRPLPAPEADFTGDWPQEILGSWDDTYIICSGGDGIVLVDQHAAHERIHFEAMLEAAQRGHPARQALLIPQTLELPRSMATLLLRNSKVFEQLGFEFEGTGGCSVLVSALPLELGSSRPLEEFFPDMLAELLDNLGRRLPVDPEFVARAACHASVRAHDKLTREEQQELLRQLKKCQQGTLCPHGRPTIIALSRKELEKRFGRR